MEKVLMVDTSMAITKNGMFVEAMKECHDIDINLVKSHGEFLLKRNKQKYSVFVIDVLGLPIPSEFTTEEKNECNKGAETGLVTAKHIRNEEAKQNISPTPIIMNIIHEANEKLDNNTHYIRRGGSRDKIADAISNALKMTK